MRSLKISLLHKKKEKQKEKKIIKKRNSSSSIVFLHKMPEELIQNFINRQCNPAEADAVREYLKKHPEVLAKFLGREEWDNTEPVQMDEQYWNEVWNEIESVRKPLSIGWIPTVAVAATIAVIAIFIYNLFPAYNTAAPKPQFAQKNQQQSQKVTTNYTNALTTIILPDSSPVILSPGSTITYNEPFDDNKRQVHLDGKAHFTVQKDQARPFTVFGGGLSTTAVGTAFTINTHSNGNDDVNVQLHEGKVLIRQTGQNRPKWKEDVYLTAGQQLDYHSSDAVASVSSIEENALTLKPKTVAARKPATQTADRGKMSFEGNALHDVMLRIEKFHGVKIMFPDEDLQGKTFTGTISKNDEPAMVLKVIAQMNDLELTETDGQFHLKKLANDKSN